MQQINSAWELPVNAILTQPKRGQFISAIETTNGARWSVTVEDAGKLGAQYWHRTVQPHTGSGLDRHWNWPNILKWTTITEKLMQRDVAFLQICVTTPFGTRFPVGQVLLSDGYPFISDARKQSVFLWYLAKAPSAALMQHQLPIDLKLLRPLVDLAIQFSYMSGYDGRISLHAATSGNQSSDERLYSQYQHIGLKPHGGKIGRLLRRLTLRKNDGRYFCVDEPQALDLSKKLDYLR